MERTMLAGQAPDVEATEPHPSFKVECLAYGETSWATNALRFASYEAAQSWGAGLFMRWTALVSWRVAPSSDPVYDPVTKKV